MRDAKPYSPEELRAVDESDDMWGDTVPRLRATADALEALQCENDWLRANVAGLEDLLAGRVKTVKPEDL